MTNLGRNDLISIQGGDFASCVANCGDTTVICQGDGCTATDGLGCTVGPITKRCPTKGNNQ